MNKVYVLSNGECGIFGVYDSFEKAQKYANCMASEDIGDNYILETKNWGKIITLCYHSHEDWNFYVEYDITEMRLNNE